MIKPYLMFNRECNEAFNLYQKAFNGELVSLQKYGDMPPNPDFPIAEDDKDLVLHVELEISQSGSIMGADGRRESPNSGKVCISVTLESEERAQQAWNALKEGGTIHMELQPTFFAKLHGSLMDRFGVTWLFSVE